MLFTILTKLVYVPGEQGELSAAAENLDTAIEAPGVDYGSAIAQMLLTFFAIIALLFVSFWFLRRLIQNRLQKGVGDQAIQIIEKRMISPKTMLYIIEVDGKKTLIAESHLEIKKLETYSE